MTRVLCLLAVGLCACLSKAQAEIVLRVSPQEGSAPKFIDRSTPAKGHCPDILAAIERIDPELRFEITPAPTPIKRIEHEIREGRLDVMCALLDTPARNAIAYRVATPIYHVRERLVGRRDGRIARSFDDTKNSGAMVVTQSGASYANDLRELGVKVTETTGGSPVALRSVLAGRADYYYTNELTGAYYMRSEDVEGKLYLLPAVLKETPSYLWVARQQSEAIVSRVERAVARLQREGELERIYQSYRNPR